MRYYKPSEFQQEVWLLENHSIRHRGKSILLMEKNELLLKMNITNFFKEKTKET